MDKISVEYSIWDKVQIKWWTITYEIIWYEYVPPMVKYILLWSDWLWKYCMSIEIENITDNKSISFLKE